MNDFVDTDAAPGRLALVTSVGSLLAMVVNRPGGRLARPGAAVRPERAYLGVLNIAGATSILPGNEVR